MKIRTWLLPAAALAVLCVPTVAAADTTVRARLVELNGSGASGTVTLTATDDGGLKVAIRSRGLVPNQPHPQHVHGSGSAGKHFMCPTLEKNDTDQDGVLTNEEATGEYGVIFLALTTRGGATPEDGLDVARMPVADASGRLDYERTFAPGAVPDGLIDNLSSLHVVQHGIDVNDNDKYDVEALGVSTFAENLGVPGVPEEATNPASCGVVQGAGAADHSRGGPEMGGTPVADQGTVLAASGAVLVAAAAALGWARASRRRSVR
ncbi:hypothetical protein GCM10022204_08860 [Microlunatus aurantiacus]|uniref:CHRD domain-containing protein n=1 Tax=Microlunatus aurantiacus TaxID=446786 RepID=A0ABP7CRS2_9ACTN